MGEDLNPQTDHNPQQLDLELHVEASTEVPLLTFS